MVRKRIPRIGIALGIIGGSALGVVVPRVVSYAHEDHLPCSLPISLPRSLPFSLPFSLPRSLPCSLPISFPTPCVTPTHEGDNHLAAADQRRRPPECDPDDRDGGQERPHDGDHDLGD